MPTTSLKKIINSPFTLSDTNELFFTKLNESLQQQEQRDFITVLPNLGSLVIAGEDAKLFLQGQLSCDLNQVDSTRSSLGLHCTPQGRVVASFRLCQTNNQQYTLLTPVDVLPLLHKSLSRYIVFSKASSVDGSPERVVFGVSGNGVHKLLEQLLGAVPETVNAQIDVDGGICTRIPGDKPRYQLCLAHREAAIFWQQASALCQPADSSAWILQDIRAGIASITTHTTEMYIPQMLNFDKVEAISFNKGCYTGQEIIARAHYRGTVKRRLHHFTCATSFRPTINHQVFVGEKQVGSLNIALQPETNNLEGLVVLQEDTLAPVHFNGANGIEFIATPCQPNK